MSTHVTHIHTCNVCVVYVTCTCFVCVMNVYYHELSSILLCGSTEGLDQRCADDGSWRLWLQVTASCSQKLTPPPCGDWELSCDGLRTTTSKVGNTHGAGWGGSLSASQMSWTFLHGRFNDYLPIPVLKQHVNSTQQNGFSKDSACMYDKKTHEAAWGCRDFALETRTLLSDSF